MLLKLIKLTFLFLFLLAAVACTNSKAESVSQDVSTPTISDLHKVTKLKITTLSTMLANRGIGEWGYAALVEVDNQKVLFDTGRKPETVLQNAEDLGIDLSVVEDVILSHNHGDHTGGLLTLRKELKKINPKAFSRIHVGKGIFSQRINANNRMMDIKNELEADGATFIIYEKEKELFPGVWITGPIERIHEEKNYGGGGRIATPEGTIVDNVPEDQSLVINTEKGFVLVAGCGHAGMINTMDQVRSKIEEQPFLAAVGGFHLLTATDKHLEWTAGKLKEFGLSNLVGAHCTGINALFILKDKLGLDRSTAVVGSVGDHFDLENGINAGIIAR